MMYQGILEKFYAHFKSLKKWHKFVYGLLLLIATLVLCLFFTTLIRIFVVLSAVVFSLLLVFFGLPWMVKQLTRNGFLHAKKVGYFNDARTYTFVDDGTNHTLCTISQPIVSISLKTLKANISIKEHEEETFCVQVSSKNNHKKLSFFTHYDAVTSAVTIDQGSVPQNTQLLPYSLTIYLPKNQKIHLFSARIIEGLFSLRTTEQTWPMKTLDLDVVNGTVLLQNITLSVLKLKAFNLLLKSKNIFVRYSQLNTVGSKIRLLFNHQALEYIGKIKSYSILSQIMVNKKTLPENSGCQVLWTNTEHTPSTVIVAKLLRSNLGIRFPSNKATSLK